MLQVSQNCQVTNSFSLVLIWQKISCNTNRQFKLYQVFCFYNGPHCWLKIKPKLFELWTKLQLIFHLGWMCFIVTHMLRLSVASSPNLLEGVDSISGQMHGGGKLVCPFQWRNQWWQSLEEGSQKVRLGVFVCVNMRMHAYVRIQFYIFWNVW